MIIFQQDSAQQRDTAAIATVPAAEMKTPQNVGYLQSVYVEFALIFGGYILLSIRRNAALRQKQQRFQNGK